MPRPAMFRALWAVWLILAATASGLIADEALTKQIDAILARGKKPGVLAGVRVLDLPSGRVLYSLNAERAFKPASNMKLLTTAAALDLLGADFKYRTTLARRGNDLVVVGCGDPGTGDPRLAELKDEPITTLFHRWAEALRAAGITEVSGRLLVDDSVFESTRTHPNWDPEELDTYYAAPVGGLNFNDNCIDTVVSPASQPGDPAIVELTPRTDWMRLENRCRSGGKGQPLIRRIPGKDVLVLTGNCGKRTGVAPVAVYDPGMLFGGACRASLVASGIKMGREIKRTRVRDGDGSLPADCAVIATCETALPDVLSRCNKRSQNLFAECLLKTLGYHYGSSAGASAVAEGSWTTGRAAVRRFLIECGISPHECVIDDGSGLSHDNRLSPSHLTEILRHMFGHPHHDVYVNSLAISGRDGTIRRRMRDIEGQVHAKTGYVNGVRTLSGYVSDKSGKNWACFAILFNGINGSTGPYAAIQDDIVRVLARWLDSRPASGT